MFATGNEERCSVMLFKVYLEKRPEEMKTTGPFYLSVIDKPVSNVYFKKMPMGKTHNRQHYEENEAKLLSD